LIADGRHGSPYTIYIFFLLSSSFPRVFYFLGPTFSPARDDVEMRLACRAGSLHFFVARWVLPHLLTTTTPTYGALATESGRWGNDSEREREKESQRPSTSLKRDGTH
jgi:hypothetical protein